MPASVTPTMVLLSLSGGGGYGWFSRGCGEGRGTCRFVNTTCPSSSSHTNAGIKLSIVILLSAHRSPPLDGSLTVAGYSYIYIFMVYIVYKRYLGICVKYCYRYCSVDTHRYKYMNFNNVTSLCINHNYPLLYLQQSNNIIIHRPLYFIYLQSLFIIGTYYNRSVLYRIAVNVNCIPSSSFNITDRSQ